MGGIVSLFGLASLTQIQLIILNDLAHNIYYKEYYDSESKLWNTLCDQLNSEKSYSKYITSLVDNKLHGIKKLESFLNLVETNAVNNMKTCMSQISNLKSFDANNSEINDFFSKNIGGLIELTYQFHFIIESYRNANLELKNILQKLWSITSCRFDEECKKPEMQEIFKNYNDNLKKNN
jgi:hypothetical protein